MRITARSSDYYLAADEHDVVLSVQLSLAVFGLFKCLYCIVEDCVFHTTGLEWIPVLAPHSKQKICEYNGGLQICIHKFSMRQRFYDLMLVSIQSH